MVGPELCPAQRQRSLQLLDRSLAFANAIQCLPDRHPNGRLRQWLIFEAITDPFGGAIQRGAHRQVWIWDILSLSLRIAGRLQQQIPLQKVVDGLSYGRLLGSAEEPKG